MDARVSRPQALASRFRRRWGFWPQKGGIASCVASQSKHPFTDAPLPRCRLAVNCVRPDAGSSRPRFGGNAAFALRMLQLRNVAILAIDASQTSELRAGRAPDLRRRTLLDGLEALGRIDDRGTIVGERSETFQGVVREMLGQPGFENAPGMNRESTHTVFLATSVKFDCEQDVGRLGLTISRPRIVGTALKIDVVEHDG